MAGNKLVYVQSRHNLICSSLNLWVWKLQTRRAECGYAGEGRPVVSDLSSRGTLQLTDSVISGSALQLYKFKANVLNWFIQEWNIIEQEPAKGMLGEMRVQTHFCGRMGSQGPRKTQSWRGSRYKEQDHKRCPYHPQNHTGLHWPTKWWPRTLKT